MYIWLYTRKCSLNHEKYCSQNNTLRYQSIQSTFVKMLILLLFICGLTKGTNMMTLWESILMLYQMDSNLLGNCVNINQNVLLKHFFNNFWRNVCKAILFKL